MNTINYKKDFPIFQAASTNKTDNNFVYLDSAATSQKPQLVIDAITHFYTKSYATVHRSLYPHGEFATKEYEAIRAKTAQFINAKHSEEIIFTKGTTEGINFIADTWAKQHIKAGDEIVLTQVEHHANLLPWQRVAHQTGARLTFIPLNRATYMLDYQDSLITERTKIVAVTHSSNVLGQVWQDGHLEQLIARAHQLGARVLLDAAQSVAHQQINVQRLNPDFLVFSTHKVYGPTGLGILYIKKELHDHIEPYQVGGSMIHSATYESAIWDKAPQKFEAGTPPIASVMGWGAAIDYITKNSNFTALQKHEIDLCKALVSQLQELEDVSIVGNLEHLKNHGHLVCFMIKNIHAHDIASYLGSQNIAVRAGHHCAQPLINILGVDSLLRVSLGIYNTQEDIDQYVSVLKKAIMYLKNF